MQKPLGRIAAVGTGTLGAQIAMLAANAGWLSGQGLPVSEKRLYIKRSERYKKLN